MREFRAKDADRDRCVEVIEAAHADGQIGAEDRELRVSRAQSAETLDELNGLTRDLHLPPGHVTPAPARAAPRSRAGGALVALVVLGALVAVLGVGVASLVLLADGESSTSGGVVEVDEAFGAEQAVAGFRMTAPQVRTFLRAYEAEFGTLDTYQAAFYPTRVSIEVPVGGARPRYERWSYDGTWRQDATASAVTGGERTVDLGTVDVRRMFANITAARRTLRVPNGRLTHLLVGRRLDGPPTLAIHIGNSSDESGHLTTSPAGDVIRSFPHDG